MLGVADDVYFVATHGADVPSSYYAWYVLLTNLGSLLDMQQKQVEKGTKNPNARKLLELNR